MLTWVVCPCSDGEVHIMPFDDLRPHRPHHTCWCHPDADDDELDVYTHRSLDQRELYETGERELH